MKKIEKRKILKLKKPELKKNCNFKPNIKAPSKPQKKLTNLENQDNLNKMFLKEEVLVIIKKKKPKRKEIFESEI